MKWYLKAEKRRMNGCQNILCYIHWCRDLFDHYTGTLRWRASNITQPCNNWRRGFRFTALERPSRSCRGHPWCHATCLVPRLFLGLYWPRSELSATLYVLRTMTMPTANLGEIPCYFSGRLKNQLNDFSRNALSFRIDEAAPPVLLQSLWWFYAANFGSDPFDGQEISQTELQYQY